MLPPIRSTKATRHAVRRRPLNPASSAHPRISSSRRKEASFGCLSLSGRRAVMAAAPAPLPAAVAGWWEHVNGSPAWQDGIFYALAVLYGLVAAASFVRIFSLPRYSPPINVVCNSMSICQLTTIRPVMVKKKGSNRRGIKPLRTWQKN